MPRLSAVLIVVSLLSSPLGCASKPRGPSEAAAPPPARLKDTAPEKRAALRSADPNIGAEADEARWGFEAARERKRRTDEKNQAAAAPKTPPAPPSGPFDIRAAPRPSPDNTGRVP
jgi:hypothetical protein